MKLIKILLIPLLIMSSHLAFAEWEKISPHTFSIKGAQILKTNDSFEPYAEIVYNSEFNSFGFSLLTIIGERKSITSGIFKLKTCNMDTIGAISGHQMKDSESSNQLNKIFIKCDRPTYFEVWNTNNKHSLYIFEKAGPLKEKENRHD